MTRALSKEELAIWRDGTLQPACQHWPLPEDQQDYWDWQDGRCGMCGSRGNLERDHDHATTKMRGLLCRSCNILEVSSSHPKYGRWRAGINPCGLLGVDEVYTSSWSGVAKPPREVSMDEMRDALTRVFARFGLV